MAKKEVMISVSYNVKVWRYIDVESDEEIYSALEKLEHDANMDLSNLGQEQPYESEYYYTDDDADDMDEDRTYSFDELDADAKKTAMEHLADKLADWNDWWNDLQEEQKEKLEEMGIHNADISFSLAYVQGDYCQIRSADVDVRKLMQHIDPDNKIDWDSVEIYYAQINASKNWTFDFSAFGPDKDVEHIDNTISEFVSSLQRRFYWQYREEWDSISSDEEYMSDMCEANEYEFTKDGEMI